MTVPQFKRPRPRLLLGLLPIATLIASVPVAGATPLAKSTPPPVNLTWSTVSPPAAPPTLAFASAVYDSDSKTVVLFGGEDADGALSNDTWVWNGTTWTEYPGSEVQAPPAREMASMAFDPKLHQLILFGGRGAGGKLLGDTWAWNGASWYDETGSSAGPGPEARAQGAMAYDGTGDLVLFGGSGAVSGADPLPTTPTSDPSRSATAPFSRTTSSVPSAVSSTAVSSSTRRRAPTPSSPSSSSTSASSAPVSVTHPTSSVQDRTATSAGSLQSSGSTGVSTASATATTASPAPPLPRSGAAVAATSVAILADTWLWTANGWQAAPGAGPPARTGAALAYDPVAQVTVLFGGESTALHPGSSTRLGDTWVWSGQAWHRVAPSVNPPARDDAALASDASTGGVVMFGGSGAHGDLSDTWLWNGTTWALAHTTGAPSPRVGAAAAYDAATGRMLVFGGAGPQHIPLGDTVMLGETAPVALSGGSGSGASASTSTPPGSSTLAGGTVSTGSGSSSATSLQRGNPGPTPAHLSPVHPLRKGDLVTLSGSSFVAGASITIWFHSEPVVVGRAVANRLGVFTATVAVPDSASSGIHRFEASGEGRTGPISEIIATVRIVGVPGSGQTSSTLQRLVLTGIALLIPGATWLVLVAIGRVRRRKTALQ